MTEFVLSYKYTNETPVYNQQSDKLRRIERYAEFLNQPLKLGMFIPCDLDDNVLALPKHWKDYLEYPESFDGNKEWEELYAYQEAKERVLFEGVYCNKQRKGYCVQQTGQGHLLGAYTSGKINSRYKKIEDLTDRNLVLTQTALKQIGIK